MKELKNNTIEINKCASDIKVYNDAKMDEIKNFASKLASLADELLKTFICNKTELKISNWNQLDSNVNKCWRLINMIRSLGIKINCEKQPINFRSPFAKCILAFHMIDPIKDESMHPP